MALGRYNLWRLFTNHLCHVLQLEGVAPSRMEKFAPVSNPFASIPSHGRFNDGYADMPTISTCVLASYLASYSSQHRSVCAGHEPAERPRCSYSRSRASRAGADQIELGSTAHGVPIADMNGMLCMPSHEKAATTASNQAWKWRTRVRVRA
jgi:hypothetical protein